MKKIILTIVLTSLIVFGITAQDRFPDINTYADNFSEIIGFGTRWRNAELHVTDDPELNVIYSGLGGNLNFIDTPLEMAMAAYFLYTAEQLNSAAEAILPHSNPSLVDRQLGAYVYMDMIIHRFLGDTAAVNRHEEVLRFITGRGNATRAEVEAFYRNGIRGLVSDMVDEQYAGLRTGWQNFNVPAARLVEVKQAITNFMLNPSTASYAELLATYRRRDGGEVTLLLGQTMGQINREINRALLDNRVLVSP